MQYIQVEAESVAVFLAVEECCGQRRTVVERVVSMAGWLVEIQQPLI